MPQFGPPLTDNSKGVIHDCNMFIMQAKVQTLSLNIPERQCQKEVFYIRGNNLDVEAEHDMTCY
jgi:hypothetical protein